ncbi:MAG: hypothetical protein KAT16_07570 [Candidatus Heimdallarchaeota archaeon]|nr:hypothetical protein [Candidatus Heimdallarchaeota archaeon]
MKIFFDSTYFFPMINVEIEKSSPQIVSVIHQDKSFELQYSSITLFELSAKGAKMIKSGKLTHKDVIDGINALKVWKDVKSIDPWNGEVQRLAFDFRIDHTDYIDCLIVASAVIHSDVFLSEDKTLKTFFKENWFHKAREINSEFEIMNANQFKATIEGK